MGHICFLVAAGLPSELSLPPVEVENSTPAPTVEHIPAPGFDAPALQVRRDAFLPLPDVQLVEWSVFCPPLSSSGRNVVVLPPISELFEMADAGMPTHS